MAVDKNKPTYQIKVLDIGNIVDLDASFWCDKWNPGEKLTVPCYAYLILGQNIPPMIVDTGMMEDKLEIFGRLGISATIKPDQKLSFQLRKYGLDFKDIKAILHTHLHIDHAGNDNLFPNAKIIMYRKELMFAVSDLMGEQYPAEYITYLVEQIHVPGKVRLIDGAIPLFPGIDLEPTEGHTWGSMNIKVNTKKGLAIISGDVIYDEMLQCRKNEVFTEVEAHAKHPVFPFGDHATGNFWNIWAAKEGVQKIMAEADISLPIHDPQVVKKYGYEIG